MAFAGLIMLAAGASARPREATTPPVWAATTTPGLSIQLASGETLPLTVDPAGVQCSVHGATGMRARPATRTSSGIRTRR